MAKFIVYPYSGTPNAGKMNKNLLHWEARMNFQILERVHAIHGRAHTLWKPKSRQNSCQSNGHFEGSDSERDSEMLKDPLSWS
jgi:hypothetical protein